MVVVWIDLLYEAKNRLFRNQFQFLHLFIINVVRAVATVDMTLSSSIIYDRFEPFIMINDKKIRLDLNER